MRKLPFHVRSRKSRFCLFVWLSAFFICRHWYINATHTLITNLQNTRGRSRANLWTHNNHRRPFVLNWDYRETVKLVLTSIYIWDTVDWVCSQLQCVWVSLWVHAFSVFYSSSLFFSACTHSLRRNLPS